MLGGDLEPTRTPFAERLTAREEAVARRRELVVLAAPSGLGAEPTTPSPSSCLSRCESSVRDSPGAPSRISLKFPQPRCKLRMIRGVQRSAKISAPRAMGQYWPYVLMTSVSHARLGFEVQILDYTAAVRGVRCCARKRGGHDEIPMPAEVGRGPRNRPVVEIDGFRGRLISANDADYDIARASGTVPLTGARS